MIQRILTLSSGSPTLQSRNTKKINSAIRKSNSTMSSRISNLTLLSRIFIFNPAIRKSNPNIRKGKFNLVIRKSNLTIENKEFNPAIRKFNSTIKKGTSRVDSQHFSFEPLPTNKPSPGQVTPLLFFPYIMNQCITKYKCMV